jgi:hypothetical protein
MDEPKVPEVREPLIASYLLRVFLRGEKSNDPPSIIAVENTVATALGALSRGAKVTVSGERIDK